MFYLYRPIQVHAARKAASAEKAEAGFYARLPVRWTRAKRRLSRLPIDDLEYRCEVRSWKSQRRSQYRL